MPDDIARIEPELFRAARVGDHGAIRREIAGGADPNGTFSHGPTCGGEQDTDLLVTPLMLAAGSCDGATVETVRLLISLGADPTLETNAGSPATAAVGGLGHRYQLGGDAPRLSLLIEAESPIPRTGSDAARLVADAAATGDVERLDVLLALGLPVSLRFDAFDAPLFGAARGGSAQCIRRLLAAGADVAQLDSSGESALFEAATPDAVRALVEGGVSLAILSRHGGDALQHHVEDLSRDNVSNERVKAVCCALIDVGIPLVLPEFSQRDRLYDAAFSVRPQAVVFLLNAGHPTHRGGERSALHGVCWHSDWGKTESAGVRDIVELLLKAGIDPNTRDAFGNTPLHEAVAGDGVNLVAAELLLAAGADVNAVNDEGQTPLMYHYVSLFDYERVAAFLLKHGADPTIPDSRGTTVIDVARRLIAGENPMWRAEQWADKGGPPCCWKSPATPGDSEYRALELLERVASDRKR